MTEAALTAGEFFARARQGRLTGVRCTKCGALAIPPKEFCPACGHHGWQETSLSGEGAIASFTVIRVAPRAFAGEAPYAIAAVQLKEGVSILGRIVDVPLDALAVGLPVRFRPLTVKDHTAIGFGPA